MDTGYPALITEPLATPNDPKAQKAQARVTASENQGDPRKPESTGTQSPTTPLT